MKLISQTLTTVLLLTIAGVSTLLMLGTLITPLIPLWRGHTIAQS